MSTPYGPHDGGQQQPMPGGYPQGGGYGQGGGYPQGGYAPGSYPAYPQQAGYARQEYSAAGYGPAGPRGYLQGGSVGFGEAIAEAFRNMFNYQGRASRSAYWWFALFTAIAAVVMIILGVALRRFGIFIDVIGYLGLLLASIPLTVRRLHDTDRSGLWYLIVFVPFGSIVLLVFSLLEGTPGPNRFG